MSADAEPLAAHKMPSRPGFSRNGLGRGIWLTLPVVPSVLVFGIAFGLLARNSGLSIAEAGLMSVLVCGGTAQLAALQVWAVPAPVLAAGLASLTLNSRYVLLGAATRNWFEGLAAWRAYGTLAFLYDTNFALAAREQEAGNRDAAVLLGGGLVCIVFWTLATLIGHRFGDMLGPPGPLGLDFVLVAFFAAMMVTFWRGIGDLAPIAVAAGTAFLVDRLLPGPWYMIAGAIAGSAVAAALRRAPAPGQERSSA